MVNERICTGLLAGFSTVDRAMTRRKELGLREAQLAQQQKNNERDFEFAQSQFEHRKENDQRTYDLNVRNADREYALKERNTKQRRIIEMRHLGYLSRDCNWKNTTSDGLSITI